MVWAGATLPAPFLVLASEVFFLDVSIKILYAFLITASVSHVAPTYPQSFDHLHNLTTTISSHNPAC